MARILRSQMEEIERIDVARRECLWLLSSARMNTIYKEEAEQCMRRAIVQLDWVWLTLMAEQLRLNQLGHHKSNTNRRSI